MNKTTQAIELGKERMRQSLSLRNNYEHALAVEKNALAIYAEFKNKGKQLPNSELLQIAVWWHDTFKALRAKNSLTDSVIEGFASANFIRQELAELIDPEDLETIMNAVRYHNVPWLYPILSWLLPKRFNIIGQILVEADTIDSIRDDRPIEKLTRKNIFSTLPIFILINIFRVSSHRFFIRSDYAKQALKNP